MTRASVGLPSFLPSVHHVSAPHTSVLPDPKIAGSRGHTGQDAGSPPRGYHTGSPSRSTFPRVTPDRGTRQPTAALWADCGLCSAPHSPPSLQRHGQQPGRAGTRPGGQRGPTLDPHVLPPGTVFPAVPPSVSGTISKECCVVHSPPSGRMSCFSVTLPRRRSRQVK